MILTITGPRSVGKTIVSKILAKKLNLKYISSDEIGEEIFKKYGGLDKATKSGKVNKIIKAGGYSIIIDTYKKDNFVFDLSGGAFTSNKLRKASEKVRATAKNKSIIIGLLPSKNINESISVLFNREKLRKHFKDMDKEELLDKVKNKYIRFPEIFEQFCNHIIYTKDKSPEKIAVEIVGKIGGSV